MIISEELDLNVMVTNRRILSELLRNGIPAGNTVMSEASAEALVIAVAAMIEENNKALLSDLSM